MQGPPTPLDFTLGMLGHSAQLHGDGDAARALAYLDTTGDFGVLGRSTLVADAARRIDTDPDLAQTSCGDIDAGVALRRMRSGRAGSHRCLML